MYIIILQLGQARTFTKPSVGALCATVRDSLRVLCLCAAVADINECASDPCPGVLRCTNGEGTYFCSCPQGYRREGNRCVGKIGARVCVCVCVCVLTSGPLSVLDVDEWAVTCSNGDEWAVFCARC